MTAEGANVLPARVLEDAFQNQYDKTLNYTDFKGAIQKLDKWYADRGIFGQVCFLTLPKSGESYTWQPLADCSKQEADFGHSHSTGPPF